LLRVTLRRCHSARNAAAQLARRYYIASVDWLCRPMCKRTWGLQQLPPFGTFRRLPGNALRCCHYLRNWPVPKALQTTRRESTKFSTRFEFKIDKAKGQNPLVLVVICQGVSATPKNTSDNKYVQLLCPPARHDGKRLHFQHKPSVREQGQW
jgi:hypothetical protein